MLIELPLQCSFGVGVNVGLILNFLLFSFAKLYDVSYIKDMFPSTSLSVFIKLEVYSILKLIAGGCVEILG